MTELSPHESIFTLAIAYWQSRALAVAAELELADLLADGPLAVKEMAARCEADPLLLFRLLRALETIGIFRQIAPETFENTPKSDCLRQGVPGSMRAYVLTLAGPGHGHYEAWTELSHTVRTGDCGFKHLFKQSHWDFFETHPVSASYFNQSMAELSAQMTPAVTAAYDWSRFSTIADIGGGIGAQLVDILQAAPASKGILFDKSNILNDAAETPRIQKESGDFFQQVPAGADAYLLRFILHDWPDEKAAEILRVVHKAMRKDALLIVADMVLPEGPEFTLSKWSDLLMATLYGGRERRKTDFETLFHAAGFALDEIVATNSQLSLIVAKPL